MSRIHEALLKAQKERGIEAEALDVERLEIKAPDMEALPFANNYEAFAAATLERESSVAIAREQESFTAQPWHPDKDRLVFMKPEFSRGLEQFRTLRSRLLRERAQRYLKTILVTGATPGEGKTFVAANLALAMARNPSNRVLIVDADLRRANLHSVFGMDTVPGLCGYLAGNLPEYAIVRQTPESQLCVVTAGKDCDTPTELLHSRRMQQFLENMSRHFDWIFIDSPPAVTVADSAVLSELCDGVLLVIAPGTGIEAAQKTRKEMGQKVLGVVLNRVEGQCSYHEYYKYNDRTRKTAPKKKQ